MRATFVTFMERFFSLSQQELTFCNLIYVLVCLPSRVWILWSNISKFVFSNSTNQGASSVIPGSDYCMSGSYHLSFNTLFFPIIFSFLCNINLPFKILCNLVLTIIVLLRQPATTRSYRFKRGSTLRKINFGLSLLPV